MTRQIDKTKRKVAQLRRRYLAAFSEWVNTIRGLYVGRGEHKVEALTLIRRTLWNYQLLWETFYHNTELFYPRDTLIYEDAAQECSDAFDRAESLYDAWFYEASKLIRLTGKMPWELSKHYFFKVSDLAALAI